MFYHPGKLEVAKRTERPEKQALAGVFYCKEENHWSVRKDLKAPQLELLDP